MHTSLQIITKNVKRPICISLVAALFFSTLAPLFQVQALNLDQAMIRPGRMISSFAATTTDPILVTIMPQAVGVETGIRIIFDTAYTVNATNTNITTSVTALPATLQGTAIVALPGVGVNASAVVSKTVDFTATGDLVVGTLYGFYITGGITNPATTATGYISTISTRVAAADLDRAKVATYNLSGSDQVTINATVPPSFTMALSVNSLTFASDLTTTSLDSPSMTVTLTTNAFNGWATWIRSLNNGLKSTAYPANIITSDNTTPAACTAKTIGQPFYQFAVTSNTHALGTGAITILPKFSPCAAGAGGSFGGGALVWQEFARSNGTASNDVLTILARAGIAGLEAAATDYTDTWTIIGAANF